MLAGVCGVAEVTGPAGTGTSSLSAVTDNRLAGLAGLPINTDAVGSPVCEVRAASRAGRPARPGHTASSPPPTRRS